MNNLSQSTIAFIRTERCGTEPDLRRIFIGLLPEIIAFLRSVTFFRAFAIKNYRCSGLKAFQNSKLATECLIYYDFRDNK